MVSDGGIRHSFTFVGGGEISTIGGVVRTIIQIANHLAKQGHEVRYLAKLNPNEKPFYEVHKNVIIEPINYPHANSQIPNFAKRLKQLNTDVLIVATSGKVGLNIMKATHSLPFPVIRSEHGNPKSLLEKIWKGDEEIRKNTFELADYSHVLYPEFADDPDLGEAVKSHLKVIPSPVELDVQKAKPSKASIDGKFKIISSGRIEKFEKNSDLLLNSFLELASDFSDWECHFFGEGDLRMEMEENCKKHKFGEQVVFHGSVKQEVLFENLASAHLFVMPSDTEGCPIALGEALAHGLPAIGFADCEGVNKMIKHQTNGLLAGAIFNSDLKQTNFTFQEVGANILDANTIDPQQPLIGIPSINDEKMIEESRSYLLADTMRTLMASAKLRKEYGEKAPDSVKPYEINDILNQWREFLEGVASRNSNIQTQRIMRYETYPELANASKSYWKPSILSVLYDKVIK